MSYRGRSPSGARRGGADETPSVSGIKGRAEPARLYDCSVCAVFGFLRSVAPQLASRIPDLPNFECLGRVI